jgi:hypothetical protein
MENCLLGTICSVILQGEQNPLIWCPWRESNPQPSGPKPDASANWATRAVVHVERLELPIFALQVRCITNYATHA